MRRKSQERVRTIYTHRQWRGCVQIHTQSVERKTKGRERVYLLTMHICLLKADKTVLGLRELLVQHGHKDYSRRIYVFGGQGPILRSEEWGVISFQYKITK